MNNFKDITGYITIKHEILYREYDTKRCSHNCPQIDKIKGTYQCTLFNEDVDHGDDDITGDYLFLRCKKCFDFQNKNSEVEKGE
jgi:hypothetical protein